MVIAAITEHTSNLWKGWPFILALFVIGIVIILFIDVDKAKRDVEAYQAANPLPDYSHYESEHAKEHI